MYRVFNLILCVLFIIINSRLVVSQVQLTSSYNGVIVTKLLDDKVTFTWNFTGELLKAGWGTKHKSLLQVDEKLLELLTSGPKYYNVPLYSGRVNGSWNLKSPGQVSFTLNAIKEVDNRTFIFTFQPTDFFAKQVTDTVQLNVLGLPKVTINPSVLSSDAGVNVTFACNTSGFPVPIIKWKRRKGYSENEIDNNNGKHQVVFHLGSSELIITNTTVDDDGFYDCEASNFKSVEARAYLGVFSLYVDDDVCPKNITATISQSTIICCPVKGHPPPDTFWQVPNGTSYYSDGTTLPIVLKTENDFGDYRCLARGLEKDVEQVVTIRKKVLQPIIVPQNVTIDLKPGDKFMWKKVPEAVEYLLRISETDSTEAISLLGGNFTSVEIPYSSLVFKSKNVDERPRVVNVAIEVEAIGDSGSTGRRDRYEVEIHSSARTVTVSLMTFVLSLVIYNLP